MYIVYYKNNFEPANRIEFDSEQEAQEFAIRQRLRGWDAVVVRK